jgi:PHD/YefM family antitoxin component YafN of YafNO toxin-antitoxin module
MTSTFEAREHMADDKNKGGGGLPRVTVLKARSDFANLISRIADHKERLVLTRHGADVAAMVPVDDLAAIMAESNDVPPDQLAAHALSAFPKPATIEEAERWARAMGTMMFRACRGPDGEKRFGEVWRVLAQSPLAALEWLHGKRSSDPCEGLFPYALMRMLRRQRQLTVDSDAAELRLSLEELRLSPTDSARRQSVFEKIIGLDWKTWPIALMRDLQRKMQDTKLEPLTIGSSGYHEERILAHLASDLFQNVNVYRGLQIASAPWAYNTAVYDVSRPMNEPDWSADIRVANGDRLNETTGPES